MHMHANSCTSTTSPSPHDLRRYVLRPGDEERSDFWELPRAKQKSAWEGGRTALQLACVHAESPLLPLGPSCSGLWGIPFAFRDNHSHRFGGVCTCSLYTCFGCSTHGHWWQRHHKHVRTPSSPFPVSEPLTIAVFPPYSGRYGAPVCTQACGNQKNPKPGRDARGKCCARGLRKDDYGGAEP
jgi:hypothetical protein